MRTLTFDQAIDTILADLMTEKATFFAYFVTTTLRRQVNRGEVEFSDRFIENIDGQLTFRVDCADVLRSLHEVMEVSPEYETYDVGGHVKFRPAKQAKSVAGGNAIDHPATYKYEVLGADNPRNPPKMPLAPVAGLPLKPIPRLELRNMRILDYVSRHPDATIKRVQSALRGISVSSAEIADVCEAAGYTVERNTPAKSARITKKLQTAPW